MPSAVPSRGRWLPASAMRSASRCRPPALRLAVRWAPSFRSLAVRLSGRLQAASSATFSAARNTAPRSCRRERSLPVVARATAGSRARPPLPVRSSRALRGSSRNSARRWGATAFRSVRSTSLSGSHALAIRAASTATIWEAPTSLNSATRSRQSSSLLPTRSAMVPSPGSVRRCKRRCGLRPISTRRSRRPSQSPTSKSCCWTPPTLGEKSCGNSRRPPANALTLHGATGSTWSRSRNSTPSSA